MECIAGSVLTFGHCVAGFYEKQNLPAFGYQILRIQKLKLEIS